MDIKQSLDHLKHIEAFQVYAQWIREGYDQAIMDLCAAPPDAQPTLVGKLAAYREIIETIDTV